MEKQPLIYLGTGKPPSPVRVLRAGSLQCIYVDGTLRHVRGGDREILRMIYPAVRDHNWGTVPCQISQEEIEGSEDRFSIRYEGRYKDGDIDYQATIHFIGNPDNTLTTSIQGVALSTFLKNRIGLNILHPVRENAGRECRVITHAGEEYRAEFPQLISPDQPMKDIRSMSWSLEGGSRAVLGFSGEVFEMEDQRNWTDASYKTYSTPLELPFPAAIRNGEILKQGVHLQMHLSGQITEPDDTNRVRIREDQPVHSLPSIGLARSSEKGRIHSTDMHLIRKAGFRHYRFDLHLYEDGWRDVLEGGIQEAMTMDLECELGLFFDGDYNRQLRRLICEIRKHEFRMARFLVFTKDHINDPKLSGAVFQVLKKEFNTAVVGTGTNANFAELNRNRPLPGFPDFLVFSITPQVHAVDPLSLVENMEGQAYAVRTAMSFSNGKPVCISPVTLRPRFNAVATSEDQEKDQEAALPSRFDPRQASLFCAGWTLGSLKYLAETGVQSITYYETYGRGGVLHGQQEPVSPDLFPARSAELFPVYYLFREILNFKNHRLHDTESSHPLRFSTILLEKANQGVLGLANHTSDRLIITLPGGMAATASWILDEYTIADLRSGENLWQEGKHTASITLNPYAVTLLKIPALHLSPGLP